MTKRWTYLCVTVLLVLFFLIRGKFQNFRNEPDDTETQSNLIPIPAPKEELMSPSGPSTNPTNFASNGLTATTAIEKDKNDDGDKKGPTLYSPIEFPLDNIFQNFGRMLIFSDGTPRWTDPGTHLCFIAKTEIAIGPDDIHLKTLELFNFNEVERMILSYSHYNLKREFFDSAKVPKESVRIAEPPGKVTRFLKINPTNLVILEPIKMLEAWKAQIVAPNTKNETGEVQSNWTFDLADCGHDRAENQCKNRAWHRDNCEF
jgi:hypothetical protein